MKKNILSILALGAVVAALATGCVRTETGTHSFALTWGSDSFAGRYQRPPEQVYAAAVQVVQNNNGVLVQEYVPHDSTNTLRSFEARISQRKVWVRVGVVDAATTEVEVQARTKWGTRDVDLIHELEKEIALALVANTRN